MLLSFPALFSEPRHNFNFARVHLLVHDVALHARITD